MATPYTLRRASTPSDMAQIVQRHGDLYSKEHNFNKDLAESVAEEITTGFVSTHDPRSERCWIAERNGEFVGCVMLVKDSTSGSSSDCNCAKLRLLIVDPSARGLGLGQDLVQQCTRFAREAGYQCIRLWTSSVLTAARRLYKKEGYRLVREEEDQTFGVKLTAEFWELAL
ncbi:GNAT family N-acetyltransferase [Aspergillus puulaauensis]|uniref:N-acetyltransferase domain-containing protein n=1 Tax=Aspergillus puulaauensis TaxID=1220207 RepID=A0A7R7XUE2_9EURO|nr:uncharacterized protein APUU_60728S [Aspergillus puulaauensis]BCS27679.1 hypothetical protein APUU_60728S [Aspergillus puulaauensis]